MSNKSHMSHQSHASLHRPLCWIPAGDVLPMGPHDVLVTDGEETWIGYYYNSEWYRHEIDAPVDVVVQHWMELPEPPEI